MDNATKKIPRRTYPSLISLDLIAREAELPRVVTSLRSGLIAFECPSSLMDKVVVAVEELFVNIAHYAYEGTEGCVGHVQISYRFERSQSGREAGVVITLEDEGVPFDPVAKPDPLPPRCIEEAKIGGLGIFMAKKSVDTMTYERQGDTNVVKLTKHWSVP